MWWFPDEVAHIEALTDLVRRHLPRRQRARMTRAPPSGEALRSNGSEVNAAAVVRTVSPSAMRRQPEALAPQRAPARR